jgi:DNA-binding NtrC family response regulator
VADAEFRADLYFRLNVVRITVPPLRDRRGDIPLLVNDGMARLSRELGLAPPELSEPAMERMRAYDWPGNVREFMNVVERLLLHGAGSRIAPDVVAATLADGGVPAVGRRFEAPSAARLDRLDRFGRVEESVERIGTALHESGGNIARAARRLGVPRSTLRHWIRRHGIDRRNGDHAS